MAKLTDDQKLIAHGFLTDLFYAGGIIDKGTWLAIYAKYSINPYQQEWYDTYIVGPNKRQSEIVCNEILQRNFNFTDVDSALSSLSQKYFKAFATSGKAERKKANILAKYIANFCAETDIIWDDTDKTTYEIDQYKKSLFGSTLYEFNCYLSQKTANTNKNAGAVKKAKSPNQATSTSTNGPKNNYKSTGPQSGNARDLVSTPGTKEQLKSSTLYYIAGDKVNANTPYLYVDPLGNKGASGTTNKVLLGSANGYTDCICFFETQTEAEDFFNSYCTKYNLIIDAEDPNTGEILSYKSSNGKYVNIRIYYKTKLNPSGYYKVNTELGLPCLINAVKLNEDLEDGSQEQPLTESSWEDDFKEVQKMSGIQPKKKQAVYQISDIEAFEEGFYKNSI